MKLPKLIVIVCLMGSSFAISSGGGLGASPFTPTKIATIGVGNDPNMISFDGTHVWVANRFDNSVSEIDASTGTVVNTIVVGNNPWGISSDGTHVWVANEFDNSVSEIDASTGTVVNTIVVGNNPWGISSDGTHVWVANEFDNSVSEIDAFTGSVINTISVGVPPMAISSDGTHVWVTNPNYGTVTEIDASTASVVNSISVGVVPNAISSDGTHVWVTNEYDNSVSEIDVSTGAVVRTIGVGTWPNSISSDGTHVWVTNYNDNSFSEIDATTGSVVNTISDGNLQGAISSGDNYVWVTNSNNGTVEEFYVSGKSPAPTSVVSTQQSGNSVGVSWSPPASDSAITGYQVQTSLDGTNWTTSTVSNSHTTVTLSGPGQAKMFRVAAINSTGIGSYTPTSMITTSGLAPQLVQVVTSTGLPVTGGSITWSASQVRSSVNYGLTSNGEINFPEAPATEATVTLTNGVMPDGSYVSGTYNVQLGFPINVIVLPPESSPSTTTINVAAPGGQGLPNATVSISGVSQSITVGNSTFTAPQVAPNSTPSCDSYGYCSNGTYDVSGSTDVYGNFVVSGYIPSGTQATVVYNDGVITQTLTPTVTEPTTAVVLPYSPVIAPVVSAVTTTAGALVSVTLNSNQGTSPSLRQSPKLIRPKTGTAGIAVRALLPAGFKSCKSQVLSGITNSSGAVTLKFCATKTGTVLFKATGAYAAGAYRVFVKGNAPTAVLGALTSTPALGQAFVSWNAPVFNGGSAITKYVLTFTAQGKKTVTVTATRTSTTVQGLAHATNYSVSIIAFNKFGSSPAMKVKVSVA
jgi:YVTN family beta-propeller protein